VGAPLGLPDRIALGPVTLRVASRERSAAWLERVLGLVARDGDAWGARGGPALVRLREVPGARPVPEGGRVGLYHYAILLPSRADLGRFLAHLERIGEPYGASDHAVSEALYLTDPDGLTVEVYADRPRDTWRLGEGGAVALTLDPLDRAGLLAAAAGSTWTGAPAGAVMGHQHFFVGDLAEAERHYVDGFGFAVTSRALRGALFLSAGGYHHHVGLNTWARVKVPAGASDAGLESWTLRLPEARDLDALQARLRTAGVGISAEGEGLRVTDPWGLVARIERA